MFHVQEDILSAWGMEGEVDVGWTLPLEPAVLPVQEQRFHWLEDDRAFTGYGVIEIPTLDLDDHVSDEQYFEAKEIPNCRAEDVDSLTVDGVWNSTGNDVGLDVHELLNGEADSKLDVYTLPTPPPNADFLSLKSLSPTDTMPTPPIQQQTTTTPAAIATSPPATPTIGTPNPTRDQERVSLLLELNSLFLEELSRLQALGEGGAMSASQSAQFKSAGQPDKMASEEYIQTMRRVQANIAYLMPQVQMQQIRDGGPPPAQEVKQVPGPALMTPPVHMPQMREKYTRLRELFPDWKGLDYRLSQGGGGAGSPVNAGGQMQQQSSMGGSGNANGFAGQSS